MSARRVVQLLAPIAVAVIVGPLTVGIALSLFNIGQNLFESWFSLADARGIVFFLVVMTYFIGWPIALLAGVLMSLWMLRRPPSALAVNAAAVIATVAFMAVAATGVLGLVEETNGRSNTLFTLAAAVFAANVCWLLLRRFALPKPAPAS